MAQVVETDTLHLVCDQKIWEMLDQEIGPNPLSHRVYMEKNKSGSPADKSNGLPSPAPSFPAAGY